MIFRRISGVALFVAMAFLVGCSDDSAPKRSRAPRKSSAPRAIAGAGKVEVPSPFTTQKDEYFYNPVGKRDPFKQYVGELIKEDLISTRAPLENFELEELLLTGIVWGISAPRALIRAPDGYSYIAKTNSRVGRNRGRVSRITRRLVFVEEEYRDPTGKLVVRESTFKMRSKDEDKEKDLGLELRMSDG